MMMIDDVCMWIMSRIQGWSELGNVGDMYGRLWSRLDFRREQHRRLKQHMAS